MHKPTMVCPISQPSELRLRRRPEPKNVYAEVFFVAYGLEVTVRVFRRNRAIERVKDHAGIYHVSRCQRHFPQNVGHESLDTLKHYVKLHTCQS
ncbi:MAG: hypothetical protein RRC34_13865 [Lentisphaeria bacterium]|nr:hypothetical protein [Lentisphaeria bacterium]